MTSGDLAEGARRMGYTLLAPLPKGGENGKKAKRKNKKPEKVVSGSGFLLKAYEVSCRVRVRRITLHDTSVIHPWIGSPVPQVQED